MVPLQVALHETEIKLAWIRTIKRFRWPLIDESLMQLVFKLKNETMMSNLKKGVAAAVASNMLFGVLYLYSHLMKPMSGTDVFIWRMPAMLCGVLLLLTLTRSWDSFIAFCRDIGWHWRRWFWVMLPAPIFIGQLWIFMWAPVNGYSVDAAVGYFLFPLVMALLGWLFLRESVSRLQWLSLALAGLGVANELWQTATFSWITLAVCGTYPIYYLMRRKMGVPVLVGLTLDLLLIQPFAFAYLYYGGHFDLLAEPSRYWLLIPLLGAISAWSMQLNLSANLWLPVPLFAMLSYLEPVLMFLLAITVLGGVVNASAVITYGLIWLGLLVSMFDGYLKMRRAARVPFGGV